MASQTYNPTEKTTRHTGFDHNPEERAEEKEDVSFVESMATPKSNASHHANGMARWDINIKIVPNALKNIGTGEGRPPEEDRDRGTSLQADKILPKLVIQKETSLRTRVKELVSRQLRLMN